MAGPRPQTIAGRATAEVGRGPAFTAFEERLGLTLAGSLVAPHRLVTRFFARERGEFGAAVEQLKRDLPKGVRCPAGADRVQRRTAPSPLPVAV